MKILYLNALVTLPTAEAEEKIQNSKGKTQVKDGYTPSKSWFLEQGLIPPKDAVDNELEYDEDGSLILDDDDLEEVPVPVSIPLDNIGSWVSSVDGGSRVYLKSNLAYDVIEEIWEIDAMVEYINMSWVEKQFLLFKSFFARRKQKQKLGEILSRPENQIDFKQ